MDVQQLVIAALVMFSVGGLAFAFLEPVLAGATRAGKRQAVFQQPTAKRRAGQEVSARKRQIAESLKEMEARQVSKKLTFEQRFQRAGLDINRKKFFIGSAIGGLVCAVMFFAMTGLPISLLSGAALGGLLLPKWVLSRMEKARTKKFLLEFPNAIDAIVRGIRSGLPLADCFRLIATEAREPVRSEFRAVVEAQAMGITIGEACNRFFERIPTTEVNFFAIVIQMQTKSGGNLGEVLANLSKIIRERKKLRDKVAAMSMEAKSSAAIIGSLPFVVGLLVFLSNPDYISLLWTTTAGKFGLGAAIGLMVLGTWVMRSMIDFEI